MARLRQSCPCSLLRFSYFSLIYHVLFCFVVDTWWFKRKQMKMLRHWCCVKSSLHRGFSLFVFLALTLLLLSFLKTTKEKLKTKSNESIAEKIITAELEDTNRPIQIMKHQANCFSPFIGLQPHQNTGMLSYMYGVKCMLLDQFKRKSTPPPPMIDKMSGMR